MANKQTLLSMFDSKVWVGAGIAKTMHQTEKLLQNKDIDGIIFGSITVPAKMGNPGRTFRENEHYTINSIGLTNLGYKTYKTQLGKIVDVVHAKGKKIIISVASDTPEECALLVQLALDAGADGVELNEGCPNKWGTDGMQSEISSFNVELLSAKLTAVSEVVKDHKGFIVGVKFSPFSNPSELRRKAKLINLFDFITYVAACNTFPNAYAEDENGKSFITPHEGNPNGYGGLAGEALHPIALGQVKQFRKVLRDDIAIMGVGGVFTGKDMQDFLKNGADAVQIVSAYYKKENPEIFTKILVEYEDLKGK